MAAETDTESMIPKGETSSFGARLDYTKPQYRDLWCAIIYLIHLVIMVGVTAFLIPMAIEQYNAPDNNEPQESEEEEIDFTGGIIVVISCAILGLIVGFIWLSILKRFALIVIKIMLYLNIAFWSILIIIGIATAQYGLAIVAIIMVLIWGLYTWCMWQRIRFSSILLSLSSRIISAFPGTVCVAITMVILTLIWIIVWLFCCGSYVMSNTTETVNDEGETQMVFNGSVLVIFVLFVSLYWVIGVNSNVSHTTSCGVTASWYFTPIGEPIGGATPAFKRSMTTSFGSICLGSLIVAVLQAIRAMINMAERQRDGNALLLCLIRCCVTCIQRCIEWFNTYAFAHCAIYGTSFIDSASATWQLLSNRGILAIINEDLTGMALFAGSLISGVLCGLVGAGIAYPFYPNNWGIVLALGIYGAFAGLVLTLLVLSAVRSAIICLFVCFAEEPAVLYENRRDDFDALSDIKPEIKQVYDRFGMRSV